MSILEELVEVGKVAWERAGGGEGDNGICVRFGRSTDLMNNGVESLWVAETTLRSPTSLSVLSLSHLASQFFQYTMSHLLRSITKTSTSSTRKHSEETESLNRHQSHTPARPTAMPSPSSVSFEPPPHSRHPPSSSWSVERVPGRRANHHAQSIAGFLCL